jgi:hypothetical protein
MLDYTIPNLHIYAEMQNPQQVKYVQPYNKRDMIKLLDSRSYKDVPKHRIGLVKTNENNEIYILLEGFMRGGLFWVIPPIGSLGLDKKPEVILEINGSQPIGIIAGPQKTEVYIYDAEKDKVRRDESNFVEIINFAEGEDDDTLNPGKTRKSYKLYIKINNTLSNN